MSLNQALLKNIEHHFDSREPHVGTVKRQGVFKVLFSHLKVIAKDRLGIRQGFTLLGDERGVLKPNHFESRARLDEIIRSKTVRDHGLFVQKCNTLVNLANQANRLLDGKRSLPIKQRCITLFIVQGGFGFPCICDGLDKMFRSSTIQFAHDFEFIFQGRFPFLLIRQQALSMHCLFLSLRRLFQQKLMDNEFIPLGNDFVHLAFFLPLFQDVSNTLQTAIDFGVTSRVIEQFRGIITRCVRRTNFVAYHCMNNSF